MKISILAAAAAVLIAGSAQAATNLVVNGNFDQPSTGGFGAFVSIPGWTSNTGDTIEVGTNGTYGLACYTAACTNLELNSNFAGSVSQLVTGLVAGRTYALDWAYGTRPGGGAQAMTTFLDGVAVGSNSYTGNGAATWLLTSVRFVATGNAALLTFTGSNVGGSPSYGNEVTAVSVASVPEPAAWAMLLTGFGLLGTTLRRRRNRPVSA